MKPFRLSKLPYEIFVTIATFTKSYSHTFSQKVVSVLMYMSHVGYCCVSEL